MCCLNTTILKFVRQYIALFAALLILSSCSIFGSKKGDEPSSELDKILSESEKANDEINVLKKASTNVEKSGGLFSSKGGVGRDFGRSNVMWKATMETLKNLPISIASYDGGVVQTDWYSSNSKNTSIKIKIQFLSAEVKVSSIQVTSFKKICKNLEQDASCQIAELNEDFNLQVKKKIIENIKKIKKTEVK